MKAGILTFQKANNYGAILQTFALQKALEKAGCDSDVIDYESGYIEKPYRLKHLINKGLKVYLVGVIGYICYMPRKRKCNCFKKNIKYSKSVDRNSIKKIESQYDLFITGSDQVWNYNLTGGDMNFLLGFVDESWKKYSYAASIGLNCLEENRKRQYKKLLSDFAMISLREQRAKEIVDEICKKNTEVVVDPTLLLTKQEWESVVDKKKRKSDYIAVYQLGISSRFVRYVNAVAKEKRLKVHYIPFPLGGFVRGEWEIAVGPAEWLNIIRNAKYVITDSYHGVIFSLIFHKKFVVEVNERNKNVGSRIYDLIKRVGLEERLLDAQGKTDVEAPVDFDRVDEILQCERKNSEKYLAKMLDNCLNKLK